MYLEKHHNFKKQLHFDMLSIFAGFENVLLYILILKLLRVKPNSLQLSLQNKAILLGYWPYWEDNLVVQILLQRRSPALLCNFIEY